METQGAARGFPFAAAETVDEPQSGFLALASRVRMTGGFSLVEIIFVLAIIAIMITLAAPPFLSYMKANGFQQGVENVRDDLGFARERATSEATIGRTHGIAFTNGSNAYAIFENSPENVVGTVELEADVYVYSASCDPPGQSAGTDCFFYGKGTASPGTVEVRQTGSTRVATIEIVGLTGRIEDAE